MLSPLDVPLCQPNQQQLYQEMVQIMKQQFYENCPDSQVYNQVVNGYYLSPSNQNRQPPSQEIYDSVVNVTVQIEEYLNVHGLSVYAAPFYEMYIYCIYALASFQSRDPQYLVFAKETFKKIIYNIPLFNSDLVQLYQSSNTTEVLDQGFMERFKNYITEQQTSQPFNRVNLEFVYFNNDKFHSKYLASRIKFQLEWLSQYMRCGADIGGQRLTDLVCCCQMMSLNYIPYQDFVKEFLRFRVVEMFQKQASSDTQQPTHMCYSVGIGFLQRNIANSLQNQVLLGQILKQIVRYDLSVYVCYQVYLEWERDKEQQFQVLKFLIFNSLESGDRRQEDYFVGQLLEQNAAGNPRYGYGQLREVVNVYVVNGYEVSGALVTYCKQNYLFTELMMDINRLDEQELAELHQLQQLILAMIYNTLCGGDTAECEAELETLLARYPTPMQPQSAVQFLCLHYARERQYTLTDVPSCLMCEVLPEPLVERLGALGLRMREERVPIGVERCDEDTGLLNSVFAETEAVNRFWTNKAQFRGKQQNLALETLEAPPTTPPSVLRFVKDAEAITRVDPNDRNEWLHIEKDKSNQQLLVGNTLYRLLAFVE